MSGRVSTSPLILYTCTRVPSCAPVTTTLSPNSILQARLQKRQKPFTFLSFMIYRKVMEPRYLFYLVEKGRVKSLLVVEFSEERSSVVRCAPPIRSIPCGDSQETCMCRLSCSAWDPSHWPPVKESQLVLVPSSSPPPHAVSPDWVWPNLPSDGRSGMVQLRPSGRITSALCGASSSLLRPPVTRRAETRHCLIKFG